MTKPRRIHFVFKQGAIGDFICYMSAIEWLARTQSHVHGFLHVPEWFKALAENILAPYLGKTWAIFIEGKASKHPQYPVVEPHLFPVNATGAHLVSLGYMYFANLNPPPAGEGFYPRLDLADVPNKAPVKGRYVVLVAGSTTKMRKLPADVFIDMKTRALARGREVVTLGAPFTADRPTDFKGYNFENVTNMIGKTTLLEAAKIMEGADVVAGLDGGLLHLAATTDVPIIFGYNVASPEHRQPLRRSNAPVWNVVPGPDLSCRFCQSRMRHLYTHRFDECLYQDLKCLQILADSRPWLNCLDEALDEIDHAKNAVDPIGFSP